MDLSSLSNEELTRNLQSLQRTAVHSAGAAADNMEDLLQELQVHRVELEMQNRALRETKEEIESVVQRYCDLYDHLPIGYVTLTPKGRIVQANLTAAGWLRRDRTELIGGYLSWFLGAFDAGRFAGHLDACVQTGCEQTLDVTLRSESGLLLTVHLTSRLAPPDRDGNQNVHTAITNITKLKQAHAIVKDIEDEQESSNQPIGQHLCTPLGTIRNVARLMLHEHSADLGVESRNMIERMEHAAARMEATIEHLLAYCIGHQEVALDPVNLEELMQQVILEHRAIIERRRAEIRVGRPLPCVRGARLLLGQVLANVLTNMLSHAAQPSPRISISAEQSGSEIVLTMSEVAPPQAGQPEEQRYGVSERRNDYWDGGIGLALIHRTIERMNGRVWVESESDRGPSFNIGLPAV